ncbi:sugar-binding protein [Bacillus sp. EB106-08-02-XG196]|uniref:sugar-binding protein n=1 Tax=Bacillus sp. EB106-08-02-XG196 TaxID=2737049 RepID=UPI0015C4AB41|nr:sugar-binding protein [Bacillus sp. EB106-08-02-XG196]NWQ41922.1 sugar-binding protein [Bacillus sp. EB106-08-02-XG196]
MNRRMFIYLILIVSFITVLGFSIYFYKQVQATDRKMDEVISSETALPMFHFTLIGEEMDHDYWRLVGEGAKKTETEHDVFVNYEGPKRTDSDEQLKLLDKAIAAKVDGIIVQAQNDQFTPMINKAVGAGIPVITIDMDAKDSLRNAYIGTDNYLAGQLAGEALVKDTGGKATIGIITASFDNVDHQQRVKGFKDIVGRYEGIKIAAIKESNVSRIDTEQKAYRMLTEYPNITAFYGTSSYNGMGIVAAAESLKRQDDMYVITFDSIEENIQLLENGAIDAIVEQLPFKMGALSTEIMLDIVTGKPVKEFYHTESSIIRESDLPDEKSQRGGAK